MPPCGLPRVRGGYFLSPDTLRSLVVLRKRRFGRGSACVSTSGCNGADFPGSKYPLPSCETWNNNAPNTEHGSDCQFFLLPPLCPKNRSSGYSKGHAGGFTEHPSHPKSSGWPWPGGYPLAVPTKTPLCKGLPWLSTKAGDLPGLTVCSSRVLARLPPLSILME